MNFASFPLKALLAAVLCVTLLIAGWKLIHPAPDGYVEITVLAGEDAKCQISTNRTTRKAPREKLSGYVTSCAFEQTIRIALTVPTVYSLDLSWRPSNEKMLPPKVGAVRLIDGAGISLWEAASIEPQWKFASPLKLSSRKPSTRTVTWTGCLALALGVVAAAWSFWAGRHVLAAMRVRPLAFFAVMVLGFGSAASVYYGLIAAQRHGPLLSEVWLHDLIMEKAALAHGMPSPRTLVIGGSSGLYGVDAAWLSEQIGQPVINLGTHAGMPLRAHYELWKDIIHPGDTVVFHLEYNYWLHQENSAWIVDQMLGWTKRVDRPPWQDPTPWAMVAKVPPQRLLLGLLAASHYEAFGTPLPGKVNVPGWGQDWHLSPLRARLDDHGDLLPDGLPKRMTVRAISYIKEDFHERGNASMDELREFVAFIRSRDAQACFAWPATISSELNDFEWPDRRKWIADAAKWIAKNGAFMAGTPKETELPIECFHDSYYHLTPAGRQVHTVTLLKQLRSLGWPAKFETAVEARK
jgi:hypothetical protein